MLLMLQSEVMSSMNPSALIGVLPGGANTQVAGSSIAPSTLPHKEQIIREVIDDSATPATSGQTLVLEANAKNNPGGQYFQVGASANQAVGDSKCGICFKPAGVTGGLALIVVNGPVIASVQSTSNTNKAIAVGDPLCLDASGNLTSAPASPAAGTVVAIALQALTGGQSATMLAVDMGGY